MSGTGLAKKIDLPVVFMTGYPDRAFGDRPFGLRNVGRMARLKMETTVDISLDPLMEAIDGDV